MAFEYECPHCRKLLSSSPDQAGQRSRCPGCGEVMIVPVAAAPDSNQSQFSERSGAGGANAASDATSSGPRLCPMCGARVTDGQPRCRACGESFAAAPETLVQDGPPEELDVGKVLSESWEIFVAQLGVSVGATLLMYVILAVASLPALVAAVAALVTGLAGSSDSPPQFDPEAASPFIATACGLTILPMLTYAYLQVGYTRLMLAVARGENNVPLSLLWSGSRHFGSALLAGILVSVLTFVGFVACLLPGCLALLFLWPYLLVIVDEDASATGSLSRSAELMAPQWAMVLVLAVVFHALSTLANLLTGGISGLFTLPLQQVYFSRIYIKLSGRRRPRPHTFAP